ncbi:MAG: hypothetical protein ACRD6W_19635 [Nitrososphaerales archaeon]
MRLKLGTKFLVFGRGDTVVMKKLELLDVRREWEEIFKTMNKKGLKVSEKEVQEEVAETRREKHRTK